MRIMGITFELWGSQAWLYDHLKGWTRNFYKIVNCRIFSRALILHPTQPTFISGKMKQHIFIAPTYG